MKGDGEKENSKKGKTNSKQRWGQSDQWESWLKEAWSIQFPRRHDFGGVCSQDMGLSWLCSYLKAHHVSVMRDLGRGGWGGVCASSCYICFMLLWQERIWNSAYSLGPHLSKETARGQKMWMRKGTEDAEGAQTAHSTVQNTRKISIPQPGWL